MATTIVTKNGSGAPTASDLVAGELAVDLTNGRLYTENSVGTVLELGLNPSGNVNVTGSVTASADVTISNGNNRFVASSTSAGDYVRMYGGSGTGKWDIYGNGANLRIGDNESAGLVQIDTNLYTVGSVGIGTTAAAGYRMDILGGSGYDDILRITGVGTNIGPRINLTPTGTGISRINATANSLQLQTGGNPALTIDVSGNLLVGKTSTGINTAGHELFASGEVFHSVSGTPLYVNRIGSDGSIQNFYKDGTTVGSIGVSGGNNLYISGLAASHSGLTFATNQILPSAVGAITDGAESLGSTSNRFKDLHLSGTANVGGTSVSQSIIQMVANSTNGQNTIHFGDATSGTASYVGYINYAHNSNSMQFSTAGTEAMRIDASGNLLVGKPAADFTTLGAEVRNNGQINSASTADFLNMYSTSAAAYRFYVTNAGQINATSTSISAISDQRLKENIRDLDDGLSKVMQLKPRKFDWKEGKGADTKNARGFIAQEFEEVFPDLIGEWKDPAPEGEEPYKAISQDLIPTLVKAIQEQQATIEALTARIAALES